MLIEDLNKAPWHERMTNKLKELIKGSMTIEEYLSMEVKEWLVSDNRKLMITGERYYLNKTDILDKKQDISWKSNQKLAHAFTRKLVDQKVGYLLARPPTISTKKDEYAEVLQDMFDSGLLRKVKNIGKEAINKGIAYLYPYINEKGKLSFMKFRSEEIIPFWGDSEHMEVVAFLRVYTEIYYDNRNKKERLKVEYYHENGINYYILQGDKLIANNDYMTSEVDGSINAPHFTINGEPYTWEKIPLIHFKYNEEEQPLIDLIKSLIDNYNLQASTNADLLADVPKFIYKLINYGGQDLEEFLSDLNKYMAVKLDENGDVDKLQAEIQTDAVEKEVDRNRNAIYEFGRGVDTRDINMRDASGIALKFRYSDLDMDCNVLETEMQSSIEHMLWFINHYLIITGKGDYTEETVEFIFNRDIIISERETIENARDSIGILDDLTIRQNHPWYNEEVEDRLEKQLQEELERQSEYLETFNQNGVPDDVTVDE